MRAVFSRPCARCTIATSPSSAADGDQMIAVYHKPHHKRHGRWRAWRYRNLLLAALLTFCAVQARRCDDRWVLCRVGVSCRRYCCQPSPSRRRGIAPPAAAQALALPAMQALVMFSYYRRITASKARAGQGPRDGCTLPGCRRLARQIACCPLFFVCIVLRCFLHVAYMWWLSPRWRCRSAGGRRPPQQGTAPAACRAAPPARLRRRRPAASS